MRREAVSLLAAMAAWKRREGDARRAGAYLRAANALERLSDDEFDRLVARRALRSVDGVGESIERTLLAFATKGERPAWLGEGVVEEDGVAFPAPPPSYRAAPFQGVPDLHCHTTWSDGSLSLEEVVVYAKTLGEPAVGISDHSGSLRIARGLDPARVRAQWDEIAEVQARHPEVLILRGTECDILRDGRLDHPEDVLAGFDYVIGSLHSQLKLSRADQTARVLAALDSPHLTILGHPTTRVPGRREPAALDLPRVFEKAAERGVALEVNGNPGRLDLDAALARQALDAGARLSLGSDAHSAWEMLALEQARRMAGEAGARPGSLVNGDVLARARQRRE